MTKRQYIDGLVADFYPDRDGIVSAVHVDALRAFAEKVYRYATRNRKQKAAEKAVQEMLNKEKV